MASHFLCSLSSGTGSDNQSSQKITISKIKHDIDQKMKNNILSIIAAFSAIINPTSAQLPAGRYMVQYSSANGKEIARGTSTTVYDILEIPSQSVIVGDYTQEAIANLNQHPEIQHVIKDENVDHLNEHPDRNQRQLRVSRHLQEVTDVSVDLDNEAQNINDIDIIFPGGGGSDLRSEYRPNVITNEVISNIRIDVPKPPKPDKPQIKTVFKKAPKPRTPPTKIKKMPKSLPRSPRVKRRDKPSKTIVVEPRIVEKVDSCMRYERKIQQLLDQKIVMQEKIRDLKDEVIELRRRNQLKANPVNAKVKANFFD